MAGNHIFLFWVAEADGFLRYNQEMKSGSGFRQFGKMADVVDMAWYAMRPQVVIELSHLRSASHQRNDPLKLQLEYCCHLCWKPKCASHLCWTLVLSITRLQWPTQSVLSVKQESAIEFSFQPLPRYYTALQFYRLCWTQCIVSLVLCLPPARATVGHFALGLPRARQTREIQRNTNPVTPWKNKIQGQWGNLLLCIFGSFS